MEFDKNRIYTAVNADELKVGSKVIVANNLATLKALVEDFREEYSDESLDTVVCIPASTEQNRFRISTGCSGEWRAYSLAYLVLAPEEKLLKWTDLKIGDVIRLIGSNRKVQVIGTNEDGEDYHIYVCGEWMSDVELAEWEKVENV